MDKFRNHEELDDSHLPLRQFPAEQGRRSRSLSLAESDPRFDSSHDRADDKDGGIDLRIEQTAKPLLDHPGDSRLFKRLMTILLIYSGRNEPANNDCQTSCRPFEPYEN